MVTAATKTGAFKEARVHEVLTQDQLHEMVALAESSEGIYRPPGSEAADGDVDRLSSGPAGQRESLSSSSSSPKSSIGVSGCSA